MSTKYCDVCGQYVEGCSSGSVRECGLTSADVPDDETLDMGFAGDCPFSLDSDDYVDYYDDVELDDE